MRVRLASSFAAVLAVGAVTMAPLAVGTPGSASATQVSARDVGDNCRRVFIDETGYGSSPGRSSFVLLRNDGNDVCVLRHFAVKVSDARGNTVRSKPITGTKRIHPDQYVVAGLHWRSWCASTHRFNITASFTRQHRTARFVVWSGPPPGCHPERKWGVKTVSLNRAILLPADPQGFRVIREDQ